MSRLPSMKLLERAGGDVELSVVVHVGQGFDANHYRVRADLLASASRRGSRPRLPATLPMEVRALADA